MDEEIEVDAIHQDDEVGVGDQGRVGGDVGAGRRQERIAVRQVSVLDVDGNLGEHLVAGDSGAAKGEGSADVEGVEGPPNSAANLHAQRWTLAFRHVAVQAKAESHAHGHSKTIVSRVGTVAFLQV